MGSGGDGWVRGHTRSTQASKNTHTGAEERRDRKSFGPRDSKPRPSESIGSSKDRLRAVLPVGPARRGALNAQNCAFPPIRLITAAQSSLASLPASSHAYPGFRSKSGQPTADELGRAPRLIERGVTIRSIDRSTVDGGGALVMRLRLWIPAQSIGVSHDSKISPNGLRRRPMPACPSFRVLARRSFALITLLNSAVVERRSIALTTITTT